MQPYYPRPAFLPGDPVAVCLGPFFGDAVIHGTVVAAAAGNPVDGNPHHVPILVTLGQYVSWFPRWDVSRR